MTRIFITGTDTDVGKTWFTAWLVRQWRNQGHDAVALKPIGAGSREDAELLRAAADNILTLDEVNPVSLLEPAAPLVAARAENRTIDFAPLNASILKIVEDHTHVAVEGVGGWRVPLASNYEVRHWAHDLGLPIVVIARAGLGTLNHTLLTVESIRAIGSVCAGVVLNPGKDDRDSSAARRTNRAVLEDFLGLPVFEIDRAAEAAGQVPVWLGGE